MLPLEQFSQLVSCAPLVSIDLVVKNSEGQVLLGLRNNRPAQGFWFVPGGRILKNESIPVAFSRLAHVELGRDVSIGQSRFLGVYQHFYQDSFCGDDTSTHYIALGHELVLDCALNNLPCAQHNHYRWFGIQELLASEAVHQYTRDYFISAATEPV